MTITMTYFQLDPKQHRAAPSGHWTSVPKLRLHRFPRLAQVDKEGCAHGQASQSLQMSGVGQQFEAGLGVRHGLQ